MARFRNDDAVQNVEGSSAADRLDIVPGTRGGGGDTFNGNGGADVAYGGTGIDRLSGDEGDDTLYGGFDNDLLYGGDGNDTLYGNAGRDLLYGGGGNDLLIAEDGLGIVAPRLSRSYGELGDDSMLGSGGLDAMYGGEGNDDLDGGDGLGTFRTDLLFGGSGDDFLRSGGGNDILNGGSGYDTLDLVGINAAIKIDLALPVATVRIGAFGRLTISNIEALTTGFADDEVRGTNGINRLNGGGGDDQIWGLDGDDELIGGEGTDVVYGGAGADVFKANGASIHTDDGGDVYYGGIGADTFIFVRAEHSPASNADEIADFRQGSDLLDFREFYRGLSSTGEIVVFRFVGDAAFSGAEELRFTNGILAGDVDGDGSADLRVRLTGITALTDADFVGF